MAALPEQGACGFLPHSTDPPVVSWGCHSHTWAPHSQIEPFSDESPAREDTLSFFFGTEMPTRGSLSCAAAAGRPSTRKDGNKEEKIRSCLEMDSWLINGHFNTCGFTQHLWKEDRGGDYSEKAIKLMPAWTDFWVVGEMVFSFCTKHICAFQRIWVKITSFLWKFPVNSTISQQGTTIAFCFNSQSI